MWSFQILFQDRDIVVINKPAGLVVNRSQTSSQDTLQDWLEKELGVLKTTAQSDWADCVPPDFDAGYGTPEEIFTNRSGIVHRLDKDTSGVLVCALNPGALAHLLTQFKQRQTEKKYTCLVHGKVREDQGEVDAPIGRRNKNRFLFGISATGRPAVTHFRVLDRFSNLSASAFSGSLEKQPVTTGQVQRAERLYSVGFSLVECKPITGRTHQIRVHLAHLQHPIVGDQLYAGKKRAKVDVHWCPRQFLHASYLSIKHPRTNERLEFNAPLTSDLQQVLTYLKVS